MGPFPFARRPAAAAALATIALGVLSLEAWRSGTWPLTTFGPNYVPMAPSTAFTFLVFGVALLARSLWPSSETVLTTGRIMTTGAVVLAILVTWLSRMGVRLPWDHWFPGVGTEVGGVQIGTMSWLTVGTFVVTLIAFFTLDRFSESRRGARWSSLAGSFTGALVGLVVILGYASGTPVLYGGAAVPMAILTAITFVTLNVGLFVSGPVDRFVSHWRSQEEAVDPQGAAAFRRRLVAASAAVALVIALSGFFFTRRDQTEARRNEHDQLDAVANLKATQIATWRKERLAEARFLMGTGAVVRDVVALAARPGDQTARARVSGWLTTIKGGARYESARVVDARGATLLSVPEGVDPVVSVPGSLDAAFSGQDIVFTDFHRYPGDAQFHIELLVPIRPLPEDGAASGAFTSGASVAAIVLRLDPEQYLVPLVRSWPGRSPTAETILVRREGTDVVLLTNPRRGPALAGQRRPAADFAFPPVSMSDSDSASGIAERVDYAGIPVISTLRAIPDSPWTLVAKMDQSEAYAPSRRQTRTAGFLVLVLLGAVGLAAVFVLRERHAAFLRRTLDAERQGLSVAQRLALITQNANDVILIFDPEMRIIEANERVTSTHGWTPAEMKQMTLQDLYPPDRRPVSAEIFSRIFNGVGEVFETVHRRKDGSSVAVEVSARPVTLGEGKYQLAMVRDITQRKAHEAEIQRLNRLYAALSQVNESIVRATNRQDFLNDVCERLVEHGGFPLAWIGWIDPATGSVDVVAESGDRDGHLDQARARSSKSSGPAGHAIATNQPFTCVDHHDEPADDEWRSLMAAAGFSAALAVPIRRSGSPTGALCVYASEEGTFGGPETALLEKVAADIAFGIETLELQERRRDAEEALRESEERLRLAMSAAQQGLFDLDVRTDHTVVSPEYATMLGYDPSTFIETNSAWLERLHPDDRERAGGAFRDYIAGRSPEYRVEFRQRTATGDYKWILSIGQVVERTADGTPVRMLGTHTDITERKSHESEILAGQARLTATLDAIPDLMFEIGLDGRYHAYHSPSTDLLAAPAETLIGRTVSEVLPPPAASAILGALQEADARGRSFGVQFELSLPVGLRWFELSVSRAQLVAGQTPRFIVLSRDITERKNAEEAIRASLHEKEALLKEVHHRVKNNLQVITSLLRLETGRSGDEGTKLVLREMQGRIRSMALLHETLYRSGNFARVDLATYLRQLATQLFRGQNTDPARVALRLDLATSPLAIDRAIPCGLIVNELLTNAIKYGFPDEREGEVRIVMNASPEGIIRLTVSDTGRGLPQDFDARRHASLGLQLVSDLTRQLGGVLEVQPSPASFTISFPAESPREGAPPPSSPGPGPLPA